MANPNTGYAEIGQKNSAPKRGDAVSPTINRLYDHVNSLGELCVRADAIASGLDSPEPPAPSQTGENPRPPSLVGSLGYLDNRIDSQISELRRHLSRIEAALG